MIKNFITKRILPVIILIGVLLIPSQADAAMLSQQDTGPTYIIQPGDTLNEIAIRFGASLDDILSANEIDDPNNLFIGQRIIIPGLEGISGVLTSEILPLGTSLSALTRQNRLNQIDLVILNRLTSPSEMIAGVSFIVPVNENQDPLAPIPGPVSGESTLETAIRSGTSPWTLVEDNQLNATWDVLVSETLFANVIPDTNDDDIAESITITANRLPLIQGETLQIIISAPRALEISGNLDGETLHFFSEEEGIYHAFYGVHALAEPGVYPLQVQAESAEGPQYSFDQLLLLSPGFYGTQMVFVSTEFLDDDTIDEENVYIAPLFEHRTPARLWEGRFQYPVDEPCVNSPFGLRRIYNDGLLFFYHTGVDYAVCAPNLNIYAPAAGEVIFAEELTIRGNAILIDHGWGVISGYWHLSEFNVTVGDFVQPGDLLGLIGNTGRSAGPHLHFEVIVNGTPVEPQTWLDQTFP